MWNESQGARAKPAVSEGSVRGKCQRVSGV